MQKQTVQGTGWDGEQQYRLFDPLPSGGVRDEEWAYLAAHDQLCDGLKRVVTKEAFDTQRAAGETVFVYLSTPLDRYHGHALVTPKGYVILRASDMIAYGLQLPAEDDPTGVLSGEASFIGEALGYRSLRVRASVGDYAAIEGDDIDEND